MHTKKRKLVRSAELLSILTKYGFQEVLIQTNLKAEEQSDHTDSGMAPNAQLYKRIRIAIEELGTTFIKLGQTLSNRDDLFPAPMIAEFKKLQDRVAPVALDINDKVASDLGIVMADFFQMIEPEPFASASISQVYKALLLDGTKVILKVKRPGIDEKVKADLLLIKDLAKLLELYHTNFKKLHISQVVASFEKTILEELSLQNERHNIEQFQRNFEGVDTLHTITAYRELSCDTILCMEYIEGIKISDTEALRLEHMDTVEIAKRGLDLYLRQVLEHGFFHADPHPGNLMVLPNGQLCFIDFGAMGKILTRDQEVLEDFVMGFIAKDAKRVIRSIKKIALEVNIESDVQLERDLLAIFELLNNESLENIDAKVVLKQLSAVLNKNDVVMPDFVYLLIRGVILMEGIGRNLNPKMNIVASIQPYIQKIIFRRLNPAYIMDKFWKGARSFQDRMVDLPEHMNEILVQLREGKLKIHHEDKGLAHANREVATALNRIAFAFLIAGLYIASSILLLADKPPKVFDIPVLGMLGVVLSAFLTVIALISFFRKVK